MEEGSGSSLNQSVVNKILDPSKNSRKREVYNFENQEGEGSLHKQFGGMPSTGENGQQLSESQRHQKIQEIQFQAQELKKIVESTDINTELYQEVEKVGKGVEKISQRPSSEDIRNFIGNIYLGDGNCIDKEFTSPSINHVRVLDLITKETTFQLSNFHRHFFTKFRTHSIITKKLVDVISIRIEESEWFLLRTLNSLQNWSIKMLASLKKFLPAVHPDMIQFYKFQQQLGPECEVLKNLINRAELISNTLRSRLLENGDYWNIEAHINSTYGRFSKSRSALYQILCQSDKAKLQADLNSLCLDPNHSYFYHEFKILASVRYGIELLKKDGLSAIDTLDEIHIMQEYLTKKCKEILASLKRLSELPQVHMDLDLLKEGLDAQSDLQKGCTQLEIPKILGDNIIEYIKKKTGSSEAELVLNAIPDWVALIRKFFCGYSMKYPKHTPLIRHQVQCSTTGTHKNCLLIIDVLASYPVIQQPDPCQL